MNVVATVDIMKYKDNYLDFQNEISRRRIEHLIHFTPTLNLFSILEHGKLMSRAILETLDISQYDILDYVQFTDDLRFDDKRYINLSISCPNTYLLSKFMGRTADDMTIRWCVLKIDPSYIYHQSTLFSVTNAASHAAKHQFGIAADIEAFRRIFDDEIRISSSKGTKIYSRHGIADRYPTDVQAEVLVMDTISSSSISSVSFPSAEEMAQAKAAMSGMHTDNFVVDPNIFSSNGRS